MFRQAKILAPAIKLSEALSDGIVKAPPQSIVELPPGAGTWLAKRIDK
jgi:hypothetical protein